MRFIVIVGDMVLNSFIEFKTIIGRVQVDEVVLDGFPEPFDPDIVQGSSFASPSKLCFLLWDIGCMLK
jgi:hypothetical protein